MQQYGRYRPPSKAARSPRGTSLPLTSDYYTGSSAGRRYPAAETSGRRPGVCKDVRESRSRRRCKYIRALMSKERLLTSGRQKLRQKRRILSRARLTNTLAGSHHRIPNLEQQPAKGPATQRKTKSGRPSQGATNQLRIKNKGQHNRS